MNKTIIKLVFLLHPWGNWDSKLFGKKATLTSTVRMLRWTLSSAPPPFSDTPPPPLQSKGGRVEVGLPEKIFYLLCKTLQRTSKHYVRHDRIFNDKQSYRSFDQMTRPSHTRLTQKTGKRVFTLSHRRRMESQWRKFFADWERLWRNTWSATTVEVFSTVIPGEIVVTKAEIPRPHLPLGAS